MTTAITPNADLPSIPAKRYFTIGEVSELCGVKQHVLRYWEQEFTQLNPQKRTGNRRYYQHHELLLIRRIRALLHQQGFTISGARQQLLGDVDANPNFNGYQFEWPDYTYIRKELGVLIAELNAVENLLKPASANSPLL